MAEEYMSDFFDSFSSLCKDFENSSVLNEYTEAKAEVLKEPENKAKLAEFQKLHVELNEKEKRGESDFGLSHHVSSLYFGLMRIPSCERYLKAENRLLAHLKFFNASLNETLKKKGVDGFGSEFL